MFFCLFVLHPQEKVVPVITCASEQLQVHLQKFLILWKS